MKSLADEIGRREFDDKAETVRELVVATGKPDKWVRDLVAERVKSGEWEQVWKRVNGYATKAYRRKK